VKRISIDAGSNMSRAQSVFSSDDPSPLQVGIGIAQRAGDGTVFSSDSEAGWMTYWQAPDRDRGSIGCAVILPVGSVHQFTTEDSSMPAADPEKELKPGVEGLPPVGNHIGLASVRVGEPLVYYLGAGWSRSGDFESAESWNRYVTRFAERVRAPLKVETGN
jgi:unsaturated rhamnogalacturonyl hydrolase